MLASHIFNLCKSSQEIGAATIVLNFHANYYSSKCLLFVVKTSKGFLTAIIDLDQRRPIVIRRVYDANVLREDYLTMDKRML